MMDLVKLIDHDSRSRHRLECQSRALLERAKEHHRGDVLDRLPGANIGRVAGDQPRA